MSDPLSQTTDERLRYYAALAEERGEMLDQARAEITRLREEVDEYRRWREGQIGVEEYYTVRREAQRLSAEVAKLREAGARLWTLTERHGRTDLDQRIIDRSNALGDGHG